MDKMREGRQRMGWTQMRAAKTLGVSQPYLSLLEKGSRQPSPALARRCVEVYGLSATALPVSRQTSDPHGSISQRVVAGLAALGYPGFAHLKHGPAVTNPASLLLSALEAERLEARVAAALPWVVRAYPDLDWDWLLREAKVRDLQNRLGFVVTLARTLAEKSADSATAATLANVEGRLDHSRLVKEDVFGRTDVTEAEKRWLRTHRPTEAHHWNVLSNLTVEQLHGG